MAGDSLGGRIAFHRKRLGQSQAEFAAHVGRSESWVSQVERGVRRVDRMSVLQKLADVLNVSVSELRGGSQPLPAASADRAGGTESLRLVLTGHPAIGTVLGTNDGKASDLDDLRALRETVWPLVHEGRYEELSPTLTSLITGLETVVRRARGREDRAAAREMLSDTYQAAAAVLAKLAEHDAAWIAADRAAMVAEHTSDPLTVAASLFRMAHVFIGLRQLAQAQHVAQSAVKALHPRAGAEDASQEALSLYGAFHLALAVVAARENERHQAQQCLQAARDIAKRLGADRNDFGTEFGPTNVAIHAVSVSVELGDAGAALDLASTVDPSGLSPERQARFLVDVARAQTMRRHIGEALLSLERAEEIAPEQTRNLMTAHDVVRDLIQLAGKHMQTELRALADRFGV